MSLREARQRMKEEARKRVEEELEQRKQAEDEVCVVCMCMYVHSYTRIRIAEAWKRVKEELQQRKQAEDELCLMCILVSCIFIYMYSYRPACIYILFVSLAQSC
jgi:hypothetical protein